MRLRRFVIATVFALSCAACTAPTATPDAPAVDEVATAPVAPVAPAAPVSPVAPARPDAMETAPAPVAAVASPAAPSRACRSNADCAVKDVGNCCGAYPMCVNKDATTDPAAVRAQCGRSGMSAVCGFQEVSGCQCVQGQCENLADGAVLK